MSNIRDKKIMTFDLETIPNEALIDCLPPVKPDSRIKDPEKIEADIAEKTKKQLEAISLNPLFNIICSASWTDQDGNTDGILLESEDKEKDLLLNFWEVAAGYDHFVTFNGRPFDVRCLLLHGVRLGVRPSVDIDNGRYNRMNHTDLRQVFAGEEKFTKGDLNTFCKIFLGKQKMEGIDGAMISEYWNIGAHEMILDYNKDDSILTHELFMKALNYGLVTI